jgi:hypothetical protein
MKALGLNSVRVPVKAEDVASLAKIDLRVILAVYGDADVDVSDAALVECDAAATKVRAAAAKAGVPVLLRVDSEEALRAYEGPDGVAYEISRFFRCPFLCLRLLDGAVARARVAATSYAVAAPPSRASPPRRRRGHRRRRRVVVARRGPHEAVLPRGHGLYETGVPFPATNGPKTIRCGFTDSTERAAQHRRFT